jgi:hypothetical protein
MTELRQKMIRAMELKNISPTPSVPAWPQSQGLSNTIGNHPLRSPTRRSRIISVS